MGSVYPDGNLVPADAGCVAQEYQKNTAKLHVYFVAPVQRVRHLPCTVECQIPADTLGRGEIEPCKPTKGPT
jgi:hypothetical protein